MTENADQTKSPPAKRGKGNQFLPGVSGNPKGKPKGTLSKTTKFRQILTGSLQNRAVAVVKKVIQRAEKGDVDSQKMVMSMLQPFIKREAERDGLLKNRRPLVHITVNKTDGRSGPPIAARVIEHEDE